LDWVLCVIGCFFALVWGGEKKKKGNYFVNRNTKKKG